MRSVCCFFQLVFIVVDGDIVFSLLFCFIFVDFLLWSSIFSIYLCFLLFVLFFLFLSFSLSLFRSPTHTLTVQQVLYIFGTFTLCESECDCKVFGIKIICTKNSFDFCCYLKQNAELFSHFALFDWFHFWAMTIRTIGCKWPYWFSNW